MKKVAIIRTDRLGDMILTLPMARAIKECDPDSIVTVIANSYTEPLLYKNPFLDSYYFTDKLPLKNIFKQNNFDIAFFPRPRFNEVFEAYKSKIPLRIGSAYRWYSFLLNKRLKIHRKKGDLHEAEYNTLMVSKFYKCNVSTVLIKPYVKPEALNKINNILNKYGIKNSFKKVIIHPGSRGSAKDWPAENFGKTAQRLKDEMNCEVLITGTLQEKENCEKARMECPSAYNLCGLLNLDELIALISVCNLLIANSTGVLHLATAIGTAVVGLYPNTKHISAVRWGPYSKNSIVITPTLTSKDIDNMHLIKVETVVESALKLLFSQI